MNALSRNTVGPITKSAISKKVAPSILISDKRRTPRSTPDMADKAAAATTATIITVCTSLLVSMPNTWLKPALACNTPIPRLVAMPKSVHTTPKISTLWPSQPSVRRLPNTGTKAERRASGRF